MKKKKITVLVSAITLISLICLQVFTAGKGHVDVVVKNNELHSELVVVKKQNKSLKSRVTALKTKVSKLEVANEKLEAIVNPENVVKDEKPKNNPIKHETKRNNNNDNDDNGQTFEFSPISDSKNN